LLSVGASGTEHAAIERQNSDLIFLPREGKPHAKLNDCFVWLKISSISNSLLSKYFSFVSLFTYTHSRCLRSLKCRSSVQIFFLFTQTANGERRSLKRQKTTSASISEANKVEEILKPCAGRQILCKS